jgi:hypothetical protein
MDYLIGVDVSAPNNTITWTPRLAEANGVSNLWYSTDGVPNSVDIMMDGRLNASEDVNFTVDCDRAFTLIVVNDGATTAIDVPAGRSSHAADGSNSLAKAAALSISATEFNAGAALQKSAVDADPRVLDYVVFGADANAAITDGVKFAEHKAEGNQIYNVNTIGYRDSTKRPSAQMTALGYADAQEIVRLPYNSTTCDQGFMLQARADNATKRLRLVVGVKNTTANLTARLSDASAARISQTLSAGGGEQTYIVDIPFRAASEDQYLYVEYRIAYSAASGSEISLKGAFLEDVDGMPSALANLSVASGDGQFTVNASDPQGETNDSYALYVSADGGEPARYTANTLPVTVSGVENFKKYAVRIAGVKEGVEGVLAFAGVVPEPTGTTDADRAAKDLALTLPYILGSNVLGEDVTEIRANLDPTVPGVLYGSAFTLQSSTDSDRYGVSNDGVVSRPAASGSVTGSLVVTASLNGQTASVTLPVLIPRVDITSEPYAVGNVAELASGAVNLTQLGDLDWVQFPTANYADYAKKNIDARLITNIAHIDDSYREVAGDAQFVYSYTDAAPGTLPSGNRAIVSKDLNNGFAFTLPASSAPRKAIVGAGVFNGTVQVEMLINGVSMWKGSHSSATTNDHLPISKFRLFEINYVAPDPGDAVLVRVTLALDRGRTATSLVLPFVALSADGSVLPAKQPHAKSVQGRAVTPASGAIDLTALGDLDWAQFPTADPANYAKKDVASPLITNFTMLDTSYKEVAGDSPFTYTQTDAVPGAAPGNNKAIVAKYKDKGFTFNLPACGSPNKVVLSAGVYNGTVTVEMLINGVSMYRDSVTSNGAFGHLELEKFKTFEINYVAPNPTDVVLVKVTLTDLNGGADTSRGSSLVLPYVALSANGSLGSSFSAEASLVGAVGKGEYSIFNGSGEALDAFCILAAYDAGGRLVGIQSEPMHADAWGYADLSITASNAGHSVKAYLWDEMSTPLCAASEAASVAP